MSWFNAPVQDRRSAVPRHTGGDALHRLDPRACLQALCAHPDAPRGVAEDALLGWLIALPDGVDPADAARELSDHRMFRGTGPEGGRLRALLREVAAHPAHSLSRRRGRG